MNTVTIFCNTQGSHLLISGKSIRVQTNRINIYIVTVVAPYFKFLNQRYISANTPKSNEPAIYLSQRYIPNNVTLKTQKRVAFYDRRQPSARPGNNNKGSKNKLLRENAVTRVYGSCPLRVMGSCRGQIPQLVCSAP